jgi:hypothetical protein
MIPHTTPNTSVIPLPFHRHPRCRFRNARTMRCPHSISLATSCATPWLNSKHLVNLRRQTRATVYDPQMVHLQLLFGIALNAMMGLKATGRMYATRAIIKGVPLAKQKKLEHTHARVHHMLTASSKWNCLSSHSIHWSHAHFVGH